MSTPKDVLAERSDWVMLGAGGLFEQQRAQQELGAEVARALPPEAESAVLAASMLTLAGQVGVQIAYADGRWERFAGDANVFFGPLKRLREAMYQDGLGTWYSAVLRVGRSGAVDGQFNYDEEPKWAEPVAPGFYAADLARFPRDEENQPAWLRAMVAQTRDSELPPPGTVGAVESGRRDDTAEGRASTGLRLVNQSGVMRWYESGRVRLRLQAVGGAERAWLVWAAVDRRSVGLAMAMYDFVDWCADELGVDAAGDRSWHNEFGFRLATDDPDVVAIETNRFIQSWSSIGTADPGSAVIADDIWYAVAPG
ncbi:hypothetical protein GOARA_033_00200 [Gordonia araii NBRC 100433]|uniref:Uncharacterized protein n=1 Tax=Gordonia araii NBRC 100433 TaxID=1073574 RepID=G7H044_9ACTN|nr:hypothetical protein [Gordonia araii]GAB09219.1 hypothetical protein GOARA_033_00200 [Gordonia araii NBRC 100433]